MYCNIVYATGEINHPPLRTIESYKYPLGINGVTRINIFEPNSPRRVFQQLDGSAPTNQIDRTLRQSPDSRTDGPYL